jgi:hypothetical protein
MRTYISEIIPKIKRYSQDLDNLTLLTNQHWVVLDELTLIKTIYIFRKNEELLIATNGMVEKAKWEYLGQNTILVDLKDQSYLFKHGFFDENILALKVDSKEEYAILINESKYEGELNSMEAVTNFLNQKYLIIPIEKNNKLENPTNKFLQIKFVKNGFSLKMGKYKKFSVLTYDGTTLNIYQKTSNDKYFIYLSGEIILFPNKESCVNYINRVYKR